MFAKTSDLYKLFWIQAAVQRILIGEIGLSETIQFALQRFRSQQTNYKVRGIQFPISGRIIWQQIFQIFLRGEYTPSHFTIAERDIVVDIGANVGVFVAYAASYTNGQILAFEPDLDNFANVEKLVKTNKLANVSLFNSAVTGKSGKIALYKSTKRNTLHSISGQDVLSGESLSDYELVDAISLDDALRQHDRVDLLKMDCEGAEFEIFANAADSTMTKIRKMVVEYHDTESGPKIRSLVQYLETCGYSITIEPAVNMPIGLLFAHRV